LLEPIVTSPPGIFLFGFFFSFTINEDEEEQDEDELDDVVDEIEELDEIDDESEDKEMFRSSSALCLFL
jgi:hypothetical protein